MKYNIEIGEEELHLIKRALDLYTRVGLFQFDKMDMCTSYQKKLWTLSCEQREHLDDMFDLAKKDLGWGPNSGPGIFNTEEVQDDVRVAADIYQTIKHQLWKDDPDHSSISNAAYPADICRIADLPNPRFTIHKSKTE